MAAKVAAGQTAGSAYGEVYGCQPQTAETKGPQLVRKGQIADRIAELTAEITAATVDRAAWGKAEALAAFLAIAQADPSDLVDVRVGACRHCHDPEGVYRWRTHAEFERALNDWLATPEDKRGFAPVDTGHYGYRASAPPDPDCLMCEGEGIARVVPRPAAGHPLYAGAKVDRFGAIEVKLLDRPKALENAARIVGAYEADNAQKSSGDALADALLAAIATKGSPPVLNRGGDEGDEE